MNKEEYNNLSKEEKEYQSFKASNESRYYLKQIYNNVKFDFYLKIAAILGTVYIAING